MIAFFFFAVENNRRHVLQETEGGPRLSAQPEDQGQRVLDQVHEEHHQACRRLWTDRGTVFIVEYIEPTDSHNILIVK